MLSFVIKCDSYTIKHAIEELSSLEEKGFENFYIEYRSDDASGSFDRIQALLEQGFNLHFKQDSDNGGKHYKILMFRIKDKEIPTVYWNKTSTKL